MKLPSTKQVTVIDHAATGAALRRLRLAAKLSMREVARRMGFSCPFVGDLEKGRRNWKPETVTAYQAALRA